MAFPRSLGYAVINEHGDMVAATPGKHDGYVLLDAPLVQPTPKARRADPDRRARAKAARKARRKNRG